MNTVTVEDLMKPRYKVIKDWPGMEFFRIGEIIITKSELIYCDGQGKKYSDYPHLFKKLEWWEERSKNELPEYLRFKEGYPMKVEKWDLKNEQGWIASDGRTWYHRDSIIPANQSTTKPLTP